MLKKWLKKRRKSSSKHAEAGGKTTALEEQAVTGRKANALLRLSPGRIKKNKPKIAGRKSQYTSIEKGLSKQTLSLSSIRSQEEKPDSDQHIHGSQVVTIIPPQFSVPRVENVSNDIKKELPLVRIRPIEKPRHRSSPSRSRVVQQQADEAPPTSSSHLPPPSTSAPARTQTSSSSSSSSSLIDQVNQRVPSPPPPPSDQLARELSYLGVASPPSIDTALFAYEDPEKADGKDGYLSHSDNMSPPVLIEAIIDAKKAPLDNESGEIIHEMGTSRPLQDGDFFTATRSHSGSGSEKLQIWLDEVKRSIDATKGHTVADFDRYHVRGAQLEEEKSEKGESGDERALEENKMIIDQALKDSIEKSKAAVTTAPRGILKNNAVEPGTKYNQKEYSSGSDASKPSLVSENSIRDVVPIKVFSKSRRQKLRENDTEEETTSTESQSSSSGDNPYETLRQLNPTVSRDDTIASDNSMNFFFTKLCDVGDIMGLEDELCQGDDDATYASRSTVSGDGSSIHRGVGWMCFDAF